MVLSSLGLGDLTIEDSETFRHIELYRELDRRLRDDGVRFQVLESAGDCGQDARLLNLAFWDPRRDAELLAGPELGADMVVHNGLHHICRMALGDEATSSDGLLFAESIASASDLYLIGRLLDRAPGASFLETQVPAMAEAAQAAGMPEAAFEQLLERTAADPDRAFESLRQLLFDAATSLVAANDLDAAARVLTQHQTHPLAPLLHHYAVAEWVLFVRAYATSREARPAVRAIDGELRASASSVELLLHRWVLSTTR